jgi:hypothetical protein
MMPMLRGHLLRIFGLLANFWPRQSRHFLAEQTSEIRHDVPPSLASPVR